jgi:hypothetical protein
MKKERIPCPASIRRLRIGPIAAQPDLDEAVPGHGTRLDEPPHRGAMTVEFPVMALAGVGVGVEMDQRDLAVAVDVGHPAGIREGDRVVATEDDRNRPGPSHRGHGRTDAIEALLHVPGDDMHVADVDDAQRVQGIDTRVEMRALPIGIEVVGLADRLGPEAGTGPIGGTPVERSAQDDDGGVADVLEGAARHSDERRTGTPRGVVESDHPGRVEESTPVARRPTPARQATRAALSRSCSILFPSNANCELRIANCVGRRRRPTMPYGHRRQSR